MDTANVQSLLAMSDKTPVLTPVHGILYHGESKSGGDFWALKDREKNTIYIKFWGCPPPDLALKEERVVTFYPDLSANKHKSTMKVTLYNGKAGLNINPGYRTEVDGAAPQQDTRPETSKLAYDPGAPVGWGDSAQARTHQIALYWVLCLNTATTTLGDKKITQEQFQAFVSSIFIQGCRDDLHKQMKVEDESEDVTF